MFYGEGARLECLLSDKIDEALRSLIGRRRPEAKYPLAELPDGGIL
jgi:hypothetical protein